MPVAAPAIWAASAIFELVEVTEAMRKAGGRRQRPGRPEGPRAQGQHNYSLQQEGLKLVVEGKTSLEELQRVFQPKKT